MHAGFHELAVLVGRIVADRWHRNKISKAVPMKCNAREVETVLGDSVRDQKSKSDTRTAK